MAIFLLYTFWSGMHGDIDTDYVQAFLMVAGLVFLIYAVASLASLRLPELGSPNEISFYRELFGRIDPKLLSLPGPSGLFSFPVVVSVGIMMFALPLTHGHYIMRFMAAKDSHECAVGMKFAIILIFILYFLTALFALMGSVAVPEVVNGEKLTSTLLTSRFEGLPLDYRLFGIVPLVDVLGGLLLASIVSASLSSVDSQLLAFGSSATKDIVERTLGFELTPRQQYWVARCVMVVLALASLVFAFNPPDLVINLAVLSASGTMALVPTFVVAIMWRTCAAP